MIDRHKVHKKVLNPMTFFDLALCTRRTAKFLTRDNYKVTCKACQKLLNEQRSKGS